MTIAFALFTFLRRQTIVMREGLAFLLACRKKGALLPSAEYLKWRLGTMYGSFCTPEGVVLAGSSEGQAFRHRTFGELVGAAFDDWHKVRDFLIWRRGLLESARRRR